MATWATPELRALFDERAGQVKEELLAKLTEPSDEVDLTAIASTVSGTSHASRRDRARRGPRPSPNYS